MALPSSNQLFSSHPTKPKIIVTDIDGTFLSSGLSLLPATIETYRHARSAGYEIVPATGRTCAGVRDTLRQSSGGSEVALYPGVYLNGGITYGPGGPDDIISEHSLDTQLIIRVINFVEALNRRVMSTDPHWEEHPHVKFATPVHGFYPAADKTLPPAYFCCALYSRDNVLFSEDNQLTHGFRQFMDGIPLIVDSLEEYAKCHHVNKLVLFSHSFEIIASTRNDVVDLVGTEGSLTSALAHTLEILPPGVNKATGVCRLLNRLKIPLQQSVALGDGDNDYEMLQSCGLSFVMDGATEKLKSVADYVTCSNNAAGWSKAIDLVLDTYITSPSHRCNSYSEATTEDSSNISVPC